MFMTDALGINQHVRDQLPKKVSPYGAGKFCLRDKLAELAQHRRLANQRRIQSADHFEQEPVTLFPAIDFDG